MMTQLPNFFIVGAPKAGTTSLYHYLKLHPEVFMSTIKEPNYFSYDETVRQNLYHKEKGVGTREGYEKLFAGANGRHKAVGEASVSYLFYPGVATRIKEAVPNARIIMSLRNPLDRAFSHYFMEHKLGYVDEPLKDIVFRKSRHRFAHLYYQQFVELGLYSEQVKRYLDAFGSDRVKIFVYDDLNEHMAEMVDDVFHFLNLDPSLVPGLHGKYNTYSTPRNKFFRLLYTQKNLRTIARKVVPYKQVEAVKKLFLTRGKKEEADPETVAELKRIFDPDIRKLEQLIQRNLSAWYE